MTKTKKQLRAEAVERLKEINEYSCHSDEIIMALVPADIVVAESNWTAEIRFIIDLLTEEEPPEGDAVSMMRNCSLYEIGVLLHPAGGGGNILGELADMIERDYVRRETDVSDSREKLSRTENAESVPQADLSDTSEKLEKDVRDFANVYDKVIELLDRQAAITQAECERICDTCSWPELAAQPDTEAYDRIAELEAENAKLRDKLSKALDHAHAIGKLCELD